MSNRHLPAGQNIQGGYGGVPAVDITGGPRRRQPPQQYAPQYHQQHFNPMYANYMPYAQQQQLQQQQYYGMPPQYQNPGMPSPGYMSYHPNYARSPPAMHQFVPMVGVSVASHYPRAVQHSPALSTPYQPPPAPAAISSHAPIPSHTPSSTHSSQMFPPPTPPTPQTGSSFSYPPTIVSTNVTPTPPPLSTQAPESIPETIQGVAQEHVQPRLLDQSSTDTAEKAAEEPAVESVSDPLPIEKKAPFRPPLPWLSMPNQEFPIRSARSKRRRKLLGAGSEAVSLPVEQHEAAAEKAEPDTASVDVVPSFNPIQAPETTSSPSLPSPTSTQRSRAGTATSAASGTTTATKRAAAPAIPIVPILPKASAKDHKGSRAEKPQNEDTPKETTAKEVVAKEATAKETTTAQDDIPNENTATSDEAAASTENNAVPAPAKAPPTSWANLFSKPASGKGVGPSGTEVANANGPSVESLVGGLNGPASFTKTNASSVAQAINAYRVDGGDRVSFLEPRGLINTGNMCYMNSVLQVLMFCVPFYEFLDQVGQRAVHSFKSDTPLIDAMIMFMQEYKVIKSGSSVDQLRQLLKSEELERYGEPFTPEFVYEAINQLPRFSSMRRGHQQDAEEFLGFLLQSLDDECTAIMGNSLLDGVSNGGGAPADPSGDWLEVGRKQRAAITRSAGLNSSTPLTKIFGGLLRSEFRVPGLKDSITTEPYQPLQLDIGSPDIRNVVDALRGLTRPERLQGDFNSPRGKDVIATKQVFIETLPPVLILHLKRFQFDPEVGSTVKIWKKVGYPLELEIPREALSRQKRQTLGEGAMPKYKLASVVYHHGKNASGGHYTVDVRRQDGREWIRLDDTVIRRVRSEDVAEGGEEEGVNDTRKDNSTPGAPGNRFGAMIDEDTGDEDGWKQVTASAEGKKRWSTVVNGNGNGAAKAKQTKDNIKDNKVAYLLFYRRV